MAITLTELFDSRETQVEENQQSIDLRFGLFGSDDDIEIREYLETALVDFYLGLPFQRYRLSPMGCANVWLVVVTYSTREVREVGEATISIDTTGGTQNVKQSLETKNSVMATGMTGPAPDFLGAINVSGDVINGVDIQVGGCSLTITARYNNDDLGAGHVLSLARLEPFVNSEVFFGYEPGEVLYLGASGSRRGSEQWEVSYKFAVSSNASGLNTTGTRALTIPGFPANHDFTKDGWDYVWILYAKGKSNDSHVLIPKALYVERVYDRGSFAALEIPETYS